MILTDLHVDGFGVWTDLSVERVSPRLTVFFGHNEAGKTTLLQFTRAVLFGFTPERRASYLPPVEGGRPGGAVALTCPAGSFVLRRHEDPAGPSAQPLGKLTVTTADGAGVSDGRWRQLLGDVDESIFRNVYAVGLDELAELATLSDSAAGELLYKLTTGVDRVALSDVMRELNASRRRLVSDTELAGRVHELTARRDALNEEIARLSTGTDGYVRLLGQRAEIERSVAELDAEQQALNVRVRVVETAMAVREPWQRRAMLDADLARLGIVEPVPAGTPERIAELNTLIEKRRVQLSQTRRRGRKLAQEQRDLGFRPDLWRFGPRIEALVEQRDWIEKLDQQTAATTREIGAIEGESTVEQQQLGVNSQKLAVKPEKLTRGVLQQLRPLVRVLSEQRRRLHAAEEAAARAQRKLEQESADFQVALTEFPDADLTTALDKAGQQVSALRRRVQLEERLDRLKRQLQDLAADSDELADNHLLSGWALGGLGALFIFGVAMILAGLFFDRSVTGSFGWAMVMLGILGTAAAIVIKRVVEQTAADQLEACEKQMDVLRLQLKQAKDERDHLDAELPGGGGPLTIRLQAAEKLHMRLEELLPANGRRQVAVTDSQGARERLEAARRDNQEAQERWRRTLEAAGLPAELTPSQIQTLATGRVRITDLDRRREQLKEDQAARRRAMDTLQDRIEQLMGDLGLKHQGLAPLEQLAQLQRELQAQQATARRRDELRKERAELRRRFEKLQVSWRRHRRRRLALLKAASCETEDDLKQRLLRVERQTQLTAERAEQHRLVQVGLGEHIAEDQIALELSAAPMPRDLEARWEKLTAEVQTIEARRKELYQQQGRLEEQLKQLLEDQRLANAQLERGAVECQLEWAVSQWQVLAVTSRILHAIRADYERQRQPETLLAASRYFARLTGGAYTRVWTPLDEDVLRVDDARGQTLSVNLLSRGTREQLFLSLRLALAEGYARRGTVMPLVLDDLFVNFDAPRTRAAAEVLNEFAAAGHQVLFFTCHEHIVKLFRSLGADVRALRGDLEPEPLPPPTVPVVELAAPPAPQAIVPAPKTRWQWPLRRDVIINEDGEPLEELEPKIVPKRMPRKPQAPRMTPPPLPVPVRFQSGPWDEEAPLWFAAESSGSAQDNGFSLAGVGSVGAPWAPALWNAPPPKPVEAPVPPAPPVEIFVAAPPLPVVAPVQPAPTLRHDEPAPPAPRWHFSIAGGEEFDGEFFERPRQRSVGGAVARGDGRGFFTGWGNGPGFVEGELDGDAGERAFG